MRTLNATRTEFQRRPGGALLLAGRPARWPVQLPGQPAEDEVLAGQEVVREAERDPAGLVELIQRVGRQADVQAREVIAELLRGPRAEDRDD